ncbi:MAG: hypothetical protein EPO21_16755 [Chloroflexota bacterium]|nr:MAG: hypothetical protein EPO21_16755 [Chloroflexota bacterium]
MQTRPPIGSILKAAVIGGLIAALVVAVFNFFVTEPVIDRAIALEELLRHVQEATGETLLVDRDTQRVGLFVGFVLYGLAWALLFAVVFHLTQGRFKTMRASSYGLLLALLMGWSVAVFPFLKYPANPPGVGDPETIQYRQILYLAFVMLSGVATIVSLAVCRYLGRLTLRRHGGSPRWLMAAAVYVASAAVLYTAMPANTDPVHMPNDVVWPFRLLSLAGLGLFWTLFAGSFAWLIRARSVPGARRMPAVPRPQHL